MFGERCSGPVLVNNIFLNKFEHKGWTVVEQGYVGLLTLRGSQGVLQIVAVYSHGNPGDRRRLWQRTREYIDKGALVVMAGDYNFVEKDEDRMRFSGEERNTTTDQAEKQEFSRLLEAGGCMRCSRICIPTREMLGLVGWTGFIATCILGGSTPGSASVTHYLHLPEGSP